MQPDPALPGTGHPGRCATAQALSGGPMTLLLRDLPADITAALDAVPPDRLPNLRLRGRPGDMTAGLRPHLMASGLGPAELVHWLAEDAGRLAALFCTVIGASEVLLRLEAVHTDACCRFHSDAVTLRLVSTYRGPGTEWLSPRAVARTAPGVPVPESAIRQMPRGAIGLMRGSREADADTPPLLHRSPPIEGTGEVRLFLAIDPAPPGN